MRFHRYLFLLLIASNLVSCEKGKGDYRMRNGEFLTLAHEQLLYQYHLDEELIKSTSNPALAELAAARQQSWKTYLSELKSQTGDWSNASSLSAEARRNLDQFNGKPDHDKQLLKLIVSADQDLIGLHVKASGAAGLIDANLRTWTDAKLPMLRSRLNESQSHWLSK